MKVITMMWDKLAQIQRVILFITSLLLAFSFGAEVILRYFLKEDLMGYEEIVVLIAFWMYLIGGAYGSYQRSHIRVDILEHLLKGKKLIVYNFLNNTVSAILVLVLAYYSIVFIPNSIQMGARSTVYQFPLFIGHLSLAVGFVLMAFYTVVYYVQDFYKYIRKD